MGNRDFENKIRNSFGNIAPDILESVLSDCDKQKGQVIVMQEQKKKRPFVKYLAGMAAALMLVVGGFTVTNIYRGNHAIASTIMLDVNPSIEIQVNKDEKVLEVKARNEDAKTVIGNMDFTGSKLDVTVNALIGSMLRNGYLNEAANSILVTVDNNDPVAGQAMQAKLMSEINAILESGNISGAVLGQTVTKDSEIQKLAGQYGITVGKAKLIKQITQQNTFYTFENLVSLTINELNLISESGGTKLENIESIGTASSSAYIGEQAAKNAAFAHAGVAPDKAAKVKCELDWENGIMVYEVDFNADGFEYEYDINAKTGAVVKSEKEKDDDSGYTPVFPADDDPSGKGNVPHGQYIGEASAKSAAYKHAGVKESAVYDLSCELDREHGVIVYEIEFKANGFEYEYDINALTGAVVKYSKEKDDDIAPAKEQETSGSKQGKESSGMISAAEAKAIVLKHSGVSQLSEYECELDYEHGKTVYDISFKANGYEYDYEIDPSTGAVLKCEKERD